MKHLISGDLITKEEVNEIVELFREYKDIEEIEELSDKLSLDREVLGLMFFQPSLRTSATFKAAIARLGGNYVEFDLSYFKSGEEDLRDTIIAGSKIVDALAIRGPTSLDITPFLEEIKAPVINGMFGMEHFHGSLWLLYEMVRRKKNINGLKIGIYGFSMYSRPALAIIRLFSHLNVEIYEDPVIPSLGLNDEEIRKIKEKGSVFVRDKLDNFINKVDFLFVCEGLPVKGADEREVERYNKEYKPITLRDVEKMKADSNIFVSEPRRLSNGVVNADDEVYKSDKYISLGNGWMISTMLMLYYLIKK